MKNFLPILILMLSSNLFAQTYMQRMPLFEEFTSSTCGPCAANNPTFDALLAQTGNAGRFACVKYQMNWPGTGDIYYNNDGASRRNYYGVNSIPVLWVDGVSQGAPASYAQFNFDDEYTIVSNVEIVAHYTWNGTSITVSGVINPLINLSGSIRIYCALAENPTHNNASSNGENTFHYVEQKMLPTGNGSVLTTLTAGSSTPFSYTYDISSNTHIEDQNNLRAIVWLQNVGTKEIYQSTIATIPNGISDINNSSTGMISIYPNPASSSLTVEYQLQKDAAVQLTVFNLLGEMITSNELTTKGFGLHADQLDISKLEAGTYMLQLKIDDQLISKSFNVIQ